MPPDRPIFALTPKREQSLVRKENLGLSDIQKRQLSVITLKYLKKHKIPDSFVNIEKAVPVIRSCVQEGLFLNVNRRRIDPGDNMRSAFEAGEQQRDELLRRIESEIDTLPADRDYIGPLALPANSIQATITERRMRLFEPNFNRSKELLEEIDKRKPIFNTLLELALKEVQKGLVTKQQVELTPEQEAGLVRNFVFSFVAMGEALPVLVAEDFIKNRQNFLSNVNEAPKGLEEMINAASEQTPDRAVLQKFLQDLLAQMSGRVQALPETPTGGLNTIDSIYKQVNAYFLVENPFLRLPRLSSDPKDNDISIWNPATTITFASRNRTYQIPTPDILRIAALRAKADGDMQKAAVYERASASVSLFTQETSSTTDDELIAELEQKKGSLEAQIASFRELIESGNFPDEMSLPQHISEGHIEKQLAAMDDEVAFFEFVKAQIITRRAAAWSLLEKYGQNDEIDPADTETIRDLFFAPRLILERVRYYLKHRVAHRFIALERLFAPDEIKVETQPSRIDAVLSEQLSKAVNTTIIDVLYMRSEFWRNVYLDGTSLSLKILGAAKARDLIKFESQEIEAIIFAKAYRHVSRDPAYLGADSEVLESAASKLVERSRKTLLGAHDAPLRRRWDLVESWKKSVETGEVPFIDPLYYIFSRFRGTIGEQLEVAMKYLNPKANLSTSLFSKLEDIEDSNDTKVSDYKDNLRTRRATSEMRFNRLLASHGGVQRILVEALASLVPEEITLDTSQTLEQVTHGIRSAFITEYNMNKPENKKETKRKLRKLRSEFRAILEQKGFVWGNKTWREYNIVSPILDLWWGVKLYGSFFGLESTMREWTEMQKQKLEQDKHKVSRMLAVTPIVAHSNLIKKLNEVNKSIARLRRKRDGEIEARVTQLKGLGAIREITAEATA